MKRLALAHFLEHGKTGHNRLRESSLEILPCQRTNEREPVHLRGGEGCHAARFAAQFADVLKAREKDARKEIQSLEHIPVHLIFDEIKVRQGVAFNASNGQVFGFTASKGADIVSFAEEIRTRAEDCGNEQRTGGEEIEEEEEVHDSNAFNPHQKFMSPSTSANVWRARTCFNQTWNVAHFFNS